MTYRNVTKRWQRTLQWATLMATIIAGYAIMLTPVGDPRLSQFEASFLTGDIFAWTLMVCGGVALAAEVFMFVRERIRLMADTSLTGIVAWCHIAMAGALCGYSAAALLGVVLANSPNIGGPTLGLLLALYHAAYSRHRPPSQLQTDRERKAVAA